MMMMMNKNIVAKRAYKALIKSKRYLLKELRKEGFRFDHEAGNILNKVKCFEIDYRI